MTKYIKGILGLAFAVAFFASNNAFATEVITELDFTSPVVSVSEGELPSFEATTSDNRLSVEAYGVNTTWVKRGAEDNGWTSFDKIAVNDNTTLYALKIKVMVTNDNYEIDEQPSIIYNGKNFTGVGDTGFEKTTWGGYAYIDLGIVGGVPGPDGPEQVFSLTFDFNGGATYDNKGKIDDRTAAPGMGIDLNHGALVSCFDYNDELDECHPIDVKKGKELDYVTVNGERHDIGEGEGFSVENDTVIKYIWKDVELKEYNIKDGNGNSVLFDEEEGHKYQVSINKFTFSMTDEELNSLEEPISREEYEMFKSIMNEALKDQGKLIAYFDFHVFEYEPCGIDDDGEIVPCICEVEEGEVPCENYPRGPFEVKIKYTDDMAGFDSYKLIFFDIDRDLSAITEEAIELTLVDGYLVGTVPHFSGYVLAGSMKAPNTGVVTNNHDSLTASIVFAIVVASTLVTTGFYIIKKSTVEE